MAGKDKGKAAGKDNASAASENVEGPEAGSDEALTRTVTKVQELANNMLKEIEALGQLVKSNKRATEVNAESIKDVEKNARDTRAELALTNERMDSMSEKIDTMTERIQTTEKLLELNRKVSECREAVSQRELNESSLFLALNGIEMTKPAKDLDLRNNTNDWKVVEEALEKSLGAETAGFLLKEGPDGGLLNVHNLNTPPYQRRNYSDKVPANCKNTLIFQFKNRGQLVHFERAIRKRLAFTREERKGSSAEFLDLNVHLPGRAGQLLESLLNSQAKVTVGSCESLAGWRMVWKKRFKSSNDMMLFAEVKAAKSWMDSEMRDFFYDSDGHQVRAQWSFLKNINSFNPKQSFFPRLKPRMTEEAQDRTGKTTSSEATTIEDGEGETGERNRTSEKETGTRRKPGTRSRSPRVEITDVQDDEEEGGEWHRAGGKNGKGGNGGGTRGRGSNRGERRGRSGRGNSSSQSSMHQYIDSTPKSRLATGSTGGSSWINK